MTELEARDEMFTMFKTEWDENSAEFNQGSVPPVLWQGLETDTPPEQGIPYARITARHYSGGQSSLGGIGGRKFSREGSLFVQCFAPLGIGNPLTIATGLGRIARDAFEGRSSPGGIWFRGCRLVDIGPTDGWYQVNAVAEFSYDEVK